MLLFLYLFLLGGLFPAPLLCGAVDYYVTPTDSSHPDCPTGEPCYTIDNYASKDSYFRGKEHVTMNFLIGTHHLNRTIRIQDLHNITLRGYKTATMCNHTKHLQVDIYFKGAQILFKKVAQTTFECLNLHEGLITNRYQTTQTEVVVQHATLFNTSIYITVNEEMLPWAKRSTLVITVSESALLSSQVQGLFGYHSVLNITVKNTCFHSKPGITLLTLETSKTEHLTVLIDNMTTSDIHHGEFGDPLQYRPSYDLLLDIFSDENTQKSQASINVIDSNFSRSYCTGVYINQRDNTNLDILIANSTISNHTQGAFVLDLRTIFAHHMHLTIEDSHISDNHFRHVNKNVNLKIIKGPGATGITIYGDVLPTTFTSNTPGPVRDISIVIRNTTFKNNRDLRGQPVVVSLFRITNVTLVNCRFQDNEGTPVVAYYSDFTLSGNISFRGNTANRGGAISLTSSHMYITKKTSVVFENNSATDVGGALFVEQPNVYLDNDPTTISQCFYQLPDWEEEGDYYLSFYNNTAKHGGEQIYGASLNSYCIVYVYKPLRPDGYQRSYQVANIFHFEPDSTSFISSNPTRICFCDSNGQQYNCTNMPGIFPSVSVHPGELFTLSAAVVGSHFGSTTGTVYAQLLVHSKEKNDCNTSSSLKPNQYSQGVRNYKECTQVQYSVYSACDHEDIILTATDGTVGIHYGDRDTIEEDIYQLQEINVIPPSLLTTPVYISVTLLPCPPGFNLTGDPPGCECYPIFGKNQISCDVTSGRVTRSGKQYVTALFEGNESTEVIVHNHCPFGYCKPQQVAVDLSTPDSQCAFNRSGILCGACKEGYSSALGSSRCLQCDNRYLALLLFFAVAGILLVLFIKVLNLTVAQGTINGLIFYANVVWANQSILYPDQEHVHVNGASFFFKTFIAWLNLDFGIETCFVQGLNGYWKTWLQFVFPFYIWAIAGVIILVSRHSSFITKLFGNNAVPVLATLFLLSYSKLLRTTITAMSMTFLVEYPDGHKSTVWSFDGNIQFCGMPHVFLFIAALAALLILWLPYTSVLLSVQWLQKGSEYKVLRWVDKLKPIFDAYFAPFKDKHHYWVGVLLLVRGVLLIIVALTEANIPTANLLASVTVAATLLAYTALAGNLYKKTYASLLDTLSLLNLVILGGGALYTELSGGNRAALVVTSVGVALFQFVGIVLFHSWNLIKRCRSHKKHEEYEDLGDAARDEANEGLNVGGREHLEVAGNGRVVVDYSKLREPLLEESSESHAMVAM